MTLKLLWTKELRYKEEREQSRCGRRAWPVLRVPDERKAA